MQRLGYAETQELRSGTLMDHVRGPGSDLAVNDSGFGAVIQQKGVKPFSAAGSPESRADPAQQLKAPIHYHDIRIQHSYDECLCHPEGDCLEENV